jgi:hypothetical protein
VLSVAYDGCPHCNDNAVYEGDEGDVICVLLLFTLNHLGPNISINRDRSGHLEKQKRAYLQLDNYITRSLAQQTNTTVL